MGPISRHCCWAFRMARVQSFAEGEMRFLRKFSSSSQPSVAIEQVWSEGIEGMILHSGQIYLSPIDPGSQKKQIPSELQSHSFFSITGWNPMGKDAPNEVNQAQNKKLYSAIQSSPGVVHIFPAFGFHEQEKWRENGFAVGFQKSDMALGLDTVTNLAKEYQQKGIYEWRFESNRLERLMWTQNDDGIFEIEHRGPMFRVEIPKPTELSLPILDGWDEL